MIKAYASHYSERVEYNNIRVKQWQSAITSAVQFLMTWSV